MLFRLEATENVTIFSSELNKNNCYLCIVIFKHLLSFAFRMEQIGDAASAFPLAIKNPQQMAPDQGREQSPFVR